MVEREAPVRGRHREEVLEELLGSLFGPALLRSLLRWHGWGELPRAERAEAVARRALLMLERQGHIDPAFFAALIAAWPTRGADIRRVASAWGCPPEAASAAPGAEVISLLAPRSVQLREDIRLGEVRLVEPGGRYRPLLPDSARQPMTWSSCGPTAKPVTSTISPT